MDDFIWTSSAGDNAVSKSENANIKSGPTNKGRSMSGIIVLMKTAEAEFRR
jgi:hypothetical protein